MGNFLFLKKKNEKLYKIASDAEKLFRDEYFEQSVVQTRRFAENLCKDLLQKKISPEDNFDFIINKMKDNFSQDMRIKEFIDDLYYLKKQGNNAVHSASATTDGKIALECLERAFEIAIFYMNTKYGYNKKLDMEVYSEELLMTGNKTVDKSLKIKYAQELEKDRKPTKNKSMKQNVEKKNKIKNKSSKSDKTKKNTVKASNEYSLWDKIKTTIITIAIIAIFVFMLII